MIDDSARFRGDFEETLMALLKDLIMINFFFNLFCDAHDPSIII
jgi:hypothetical protein